MSSPTVSVITPTRGRHELLLQRCLPSVAAQLYGGHVEHVIVSDGPDPELRALLQDRPRSGLWKLTFDELPEHAGANAARRRGIELASGQLLAYCDDDDELRPRHLELLVDRLLHAGADFAYGRMQTWIWTYPAGGPRITAGRVVGADPPVMGQIGTPVVHRRELLEIATWGEPSPVEDWLLFDAWMAAGASWSFLPLVTYDYHARPRATARPA